MITLSAQILYKDAALAGLSGAVHLAVRTDGLAGTGTSVDPFNCAGATPEDQATAFDALMNSFTTNVNIMLAPGTFYTRGPLSGAGGSEVKDGQIISGSGIDITTLKIIDNIAGGVRYMVVGVDSGLTTATLQDLTIDCNFANQGATAPTYGVVMPGGTARRIKITEWGNNDHDHEAFLFNVEEAIYCEVGAPAAVNLDGGCTALTATRATFCYIHDIPAGDTNELSYIQAMSANLTNCYIRFNRVMDVEGNGVYADSSDGTNTEIADNQFVNVKKGIYLNASAHTFKNLAITDNLIAVDGADQAISLDVNGASYNCRIRGTRIVATSTDTAAKIIVTGFKCLAVTDTMLDSDRVNPNPSLYAYGPTTTPLLVLGNFRKNGEMLDCYDSHTGAATWPNGTGT